MTCTEPQTETARYNHQKKKKSFPGLKGWGYRNVEIQAIFKSFTRDQP